MANGKGKSGNNRKSSKFIEAESYRHRDAASLMRPDVGMQPQFKERKPPVPYHYDSSLAPEFQPKTD